MKNKIIYIGLTEDPEVTPIKKSYCISKAGFNKIYSVGNYILYLDESYTRQFRREEWNQVERNAYRITSMVAIKNNLEEGERIALLWG
jgi:hypothetical protein